MRPMEIFMLFVHLLVLVLVFILLYWVVKLLASIAPTPIAKQVEVVLTILLALMAIAFLLGDFGYWGTWGLHRHK